VCKNRTYTTHKVNGRRGCSMKLIFLCVCVCDSLGNRKRRQNRYLDLIFLTVYILRYCIAGRLLIFLADALT